MGNSPSKPRFLSFETKVLIPVLGVLILLPAITVWIVDRHLTDQAHEEARQTLETAEAVFKNSIEIRTRNLISRFRTAVNEPRFKAVAQLADKATLTAFLQDSIREFGDETELVFYSTDSETPLAGARRDVSISIESFAGASSETVSMALNGELNAGMVIVQDRAFDVISVPVFLNERSNLLGTLTVGVRLGERAVNDIKSLTRTEVLLFANDRLSVGTVQHPGIAPEVVENLWTTEPSKESIEIDSEHFLALAGSITTSGANAQLHYLLLSSYENRLQALRNTRTMLVVVSMIGIAVSGLIVWFLIRRITQPLRNLRDGAEAVGSGDFSRRIEKFSNDECGELAESFNRMTGNLQLSRAELQRTVNTLRETQRQLVEREARLRESEEELRLIIESATDHAIFTIGNQGRILRWNNAAERLLGYHAGEASGLAYNIFFTADDRGLGRPERSLAEADDTGQFSYEGWRVRRDGSRFWADITISRLPAGSGSKSAGFVEIARDITVRKEAEEALRAARDSAESASRAKSEFLANMSHELRTPMNAIIGMSSLLLDQKLESEPRQFTETIRGSADSLLRIIDDILDISKIEAGQLEVREQAVDLETFIEETTAFVAPTIHAKGLDMAVYVDPDLPPAVFTDARRLRQILRSLLDNAGKFTESGGISLRVKRTPGKPTDLVQFSIEDTGIGIPRDQQDRIFEAFTQVDASFTRKFGGSGLGLAISKRLVELLGGTLSVESTSGQGSCFSFTIHAPSAIDASSIPGFQRRNLSGTRVLIIAEQPTLRDTLADQFAAWNSDVAAVSSQAEAFVHLNPGCGISAIVMDADETSIDALQGFISAVHNRMADAAPRLIVLSLKSIDGIPVPAGSTRIIEKPALPRVLFDETVRLVWQRAGPSPDRLEKKSEKQRDFAESRPMRILVVEDNPINSRVIGLILKKLGYTCDLAENGRIALERLSANNYEVVFMDLQMPEVDGLEATRRIRKATPFTEPPYIIALTANAREEDRKACAEAGMHAFQSKPAHVEKISNALEEAWDWLQVHGCPRTSS